MNNCKKKRPACKKTQTRDIVSEHFLENIPTLVYSHKWSFARAVVRDNGLCSSEYHCASESHSLFQLCNESVYILPTEQGPHRDHIYDRNTHIPTIEYRMGWNLTSVIPFAIEFRYFEYPPPGKTNTIRGQNLFHVIVCIITHIFEHHICPIYVYICDKQKHHWQICAN